MTAHSDITSPEPRLGIYLLMCWDMEYPFGVRGWPPEDFDRFFKLLKALGYNLVMFWPYTEAMPAPLSDSDRRTLGELRDLADSAHAAGLQFWQVFCPNVMSRPEVANVEFKHRQMLPYKIDIRLDDEGARERYFAHRREIFRILNNADGYATIDGDPGSYSGAQPAEYLRIMDADRAALDEFGTHPDRQLVIPWIWSGWGSDWEKNGIWGEEIEPLTGPLLTALPGGMKEPWEMLPGRSNHDGWANGRVNFRMAEDAGLIERSTLLLYEAVEYEPTPPAIVLQFDDIRRILAEEGHNIPRSRGVMINAQNPILALPCLYFFARAMREPGYVDRADLDILKHLAAELGGPEDILLAAWQCLTLPLDRLPASLPDALESAALTGPLAEFLPGGLMRYRKALAELVRARRDVLCAVGLDRPEDALYVATSALVRWWRMHRYVFSGAGGVDFAWEYTHPLLLAPLTEYVKRAAPDSRAVHRAAKRLAETAWLDSGLALRLLSSISG